MQNDLDGYLPFQMDMVFLLIYTISNNLISPTFCEQYMMPVITKYRENACHLLKFDVN